MTFTQIIPLHKCINIASELRAVTLPQCLKGWKWGPRCLVIDAFEYISVHHKNISQMLDEISRDFAVLPWLNTEYWGGFRFLLFLAPGSKVNGATMGPIWADRTQVGPMLAPLTLLSEISPLGRETAYMEQKQSVFKIMLWKWESRNEASFYGLVRMLKHTRGCLFTT